jgi:hypothetical protein
MWMFGFPSPLGHVAYDALNLSMESNISGAASGNDMTPAPSSSSSSSRRRITKKGQQAAEDTDDDDDDAGDVDVEASMNDSVNLSLSEQPVRARGRGKRGRKLPAKRGAAAAMVVVASRADIKDEVDEDEEPGQHDKDQGQGPEHHQLTAEQQQQAIWGFLATNGSTGAHGTPYRKSDPFGAASTPTPNGSARDSHDASFSSSNSSLLHHSHSSSFAASPLPASFNSSMLSSDGDADGATGSSSSSLDWLGLAPSPASPVPARSSSDPLAARSRDGQSAGFKSPGGLLLAGMTGGLRGSSLFSPPPPSAASPSGLDSSASDALTGRPPQHPLSMSLRQRGNHKLIPLTSAQRPGPLASSATSPSPSLQPMSAAMTSSSASSAPTSHAGSPAAFSSSTTVGLCALGVDMGSSSASVPASSPNLISSLAPSMSASQILLGTPGPFHLSRYVNRPSPGIECSAYIPTTHQSSHTIVVY